MYRPMRMQKEGGEEKSEDLKEREQEAGEKGGENCRHGDEED